MIDPRIRKLHVARYGETDGLAGYLRTLENLVPIPDDKRGENHHMLARSVWPEHADLRTNPWNRLRVSHAIHTALTELQSRFEERLQSAARRMKGQSAEAHIEACRKGGRIAGQIAAAKPEYFSHLGRLGGKQGGLKGGKRVHEIHPEMAKENGKKNGKKNVESGQLKGVACLGGKKVYELYPEQRIQITKKINHVRWHVNRGMFNPTCSFCVVNQASEL